MITTQSKVDSRFKRITNHVMSEEPPDRGKPKSGKWEMVGIQRLIPRHLRMFCQILFHENLINQRPNNQTKHIVIILYQNQPATNYNPSSATLATSSRKDVNSNRYILDYLETNNTSCPWQCDNQWASICRRGLGASVQAIHAFSIFFTGDRNRLPCSHIDPC